MTTSCLSSLEELHGALVPFGGRARLERAEVAALAGLGIFLPRVEPVRSVGELPDHDALGGRRRRVVVARAAFAAAGDPFARRAGGWLTVFCHASVVASPRTSGSTQSRRTRVHPWRPHAPLSGANVVG